MVGSGSVHTRKRIIACWAAILVSLTATEGRAQDLTKLPNVVDKVGASIVSIATAPPTETKIQPTVGAGIVLSDDGFIATAANIVEGVDIANVTLADGTKLVGTVVGSDSRTNVAILKVRASTLLREAQLADSNLVRRGQPVFTIGDPFGFTGSVSIGVISAKGRTINADSPYEYLQTDAAINQGNAGGALFDFDGNVVGMVQSIYSPTNGSVGIGFALPSNDVKEVAQKIEGSGTVARGWLGVKLQDLTADTAASLGLTEVSGALISETVVGGPGAAGGLKAGDVIVGADDEKVTDSRSGARVVGSKSPGANIDFKVWRDRAFQTVRVRLGTFPKAPPAEAGQAEAPNRAGSSSSPTAR
jgi:serine protease Do